ncbi:MAG: primosomal protein N' [Chloroflexia bacterium]
MGTRRTYAIVALDGGFRNGPAGSSDNRQMGGEERDEGTLEGLLLHYRVPDYLQGHIEPGHIVTVPLRGRPAYGVVTGLSDEAPVPETLPIRELVDARQVVLPHMMALARWIAGYYHCTLWQALAPMLPPGVARRAVTTLGLSPDFVRDGETDPLIAALGRRQQQVVLLLQEAPKSTLTLARLKRSYSGAPSGLNAALRSLEREGVVTRHTQLPTPHGKPQHERIIRLAVGSEAAGDAVSDAAHRAPLQAAALSWLMKQASRSISEARGAVADDGQGAAFRVYDEGAQEYRANGTTGGWVSSGELTVEQGWLRLRDLYLHTGATSATVSALEKKGLVELSDRQVERKPVPANAASLNDEPPTLTSAQATALNEIAAALRALKVGEADTADPQQIQDSKLKTQNYLLHGVTGSGKTEIYLRAIAMALRMRRQALVLVPEISLTPQAVHRFASRFPGRVALVHSQLPPRQQFDEWRRIREGQADIVIGSRSAVFAPLPRLGLIVVDEEHEWAYKQDHAPRYHARDVALKRAELTGSVVILGSATPDLATYYKAQRGEYRLLSLPTRVGRRRVRGGSELITELPMPPVQIIDMRAELRTGNHSMFSRALQTGLDSTLARKEQAILYLNRRGSSSFILCRECGHVPNCLRCDVPLVYHADIYGMLCHRCNAHSLTPRECPKCGSGQIKGFGVGTQKVVDEVTALFPRARVLRWDRDTASRHGGHEGIMDMFTRGDADVLVGTQMIAKGLDIARVTLVGVISADTGLYLPDFRAPERSLQLLMQVAGRAGRRTETTHSRVVVQTYNPDHYAIQAAARHDYKGFYAGEIRFRAEHGYPPYGQLARLVYSSQSNERCEQEATAVARYLRGKAESHGLQPKDGGEDSRTTCIDVLGPAPCFVHKVRGQFRWQVLIRADSVAPLLEGFNPGPGWVLDVDPLSVL